nr:hypothetical protein [uncultured Methanobrevibacter sp.]
MNKTSEVVSIVLILNLFVMYAVGGIITPSTNRKTEYVHCTVAEELRNQPYNRAGLLLLYSAISMRLQKPL